VLSIAVTVKTTAFALRIKPQQLLLSLFLLEFFIVLGSFESYFFDALFQIRAFRPSLVAVKDASSVPALKEALAGIEKLPEIMVGDEGLVEVSHILLCMRFT